MSIPRWRALDHLFVFEKIAMHRLELLQRGDRAPVGVDHFETILFEKTGKIGVE
jgi:endonuclease/exonuclease/phosphatase family metal-dependent hydrolase